MTTIEASETTVESEDRTAARAGAPGLGDVLVILRAEWDRALAAALAVLSVVFILMTYRGVARTPFVAEQVSYLASGGFAAVWCAAGAATLLVSAGHHDEWCKLNRLEELLAGSDGSVDAASSMKGSRERQEPRTPRSIALVATSIVFALGAGAAALGWRAAAATSDVGDAAGGLRTSLMSGVFLAVTCVGVSVIGRQRLLMRRATLLRGLLAPLPRDQVPATAPSILRDGTDPATVYSAPGLSRYHRSGCPSLVGVDAAVIEHSAIRQLQACDLCVAVPTEP